MHTTFSEKAKQQKLVSRTNSLAMPAISKREAEEFLVIVAGGCLLSANAGFINSATLLQSGYTVTHVTGALTKASILLRDGNGVDFGFVMLNILGFIVGSAICATIITKHVFHLSRCYIHVFTLGTLLLVLSYLLYFFFPNRRDYVYCVSVTCGMQNAMTTSYSGNVLRTTHMTGTATDIGIVLGRMLKGRYEDIWKLKLMVPMFVSFFLGGLLAAVAFHEFAHNILVVNIALFGGTGLLYVIYLLHAIAKFDLKEDTEEGFFSETNPNPGDSFEVTSALDDAIDQDEDDDQL